MVSMKELACAAILLVSGVELGGCVDDATGRVADDAEAITANLVVSAAEAVSQGRQMSAAERARREAEMRGAPPPLVEGPALLLSEIPRLTGAARVEAM